MSVQPHAEAAEAGGPSKPGAMLARPGDKGSPGNPSPSPAAAAAAAASGKPSPVAQNSVLGRDGQADVPAAHTSLDEGAGPAVHAKTENNAGQNAGGGSASQVCPMAMVTLT